MGEVTHSLPGLNIRLANEAALILGELIVEPATRQVRNGDREETLEPRVMQVLVALGRAKGSVVSRDELIESCWSGRIVGEDAIHRVLSRLRAVASDIGGGSFQIETIRGVGYRLSDGSAPKPDGDGLSRRSLVVMSSVLAAVGVGASVRYFAIRSHKPIPLAVQYYQRGLATRFQALPQVAEQGTEFFREATRIDPQFADAWGALAWSYRGLLEFGHQRPDAERLIALSRSAAKRALALDPDNSDAKATLLLSKPYLHHWLEIERGLRALLKKNPSDSTLQWCLASVFADVGRNREAIRIVRVVCEREPFWPLPRVGFAFSLFANGQDEEAEDVLDDSMKRFPRRIDLWFAKIDLLMINSRYAEALQFASDPAMQPAEKFEPVIGLQMALLNALTDGSDKAKQAALDKIKDTVRADPSSLFFAAAAVAVLGRIDTCFAMLDGVYFGVGPWAAGRQDRPDTAPLFGRLISPLRSDARFLRLVTKVGLADYWRLSGTLPDYRRYP